MASERTIFLSGPMGAGKSTVARALGARLGRAVVDLDAEVERRAGRRIADIFASAGEDAFRQLEAEALSALLAHPAPRIVALGGGTAAQDRLRAQMLQSGWLVTLAAPLQVLLRRTQGDATRPLLAASADPSAALADILAARRGAYAECHVRLDTVEQDRDLDADALAVRIIAALAHAPVVVPLAERSYRVRIGAGCRADLAAHLCGLSPTVSRWLLCSDSGVAPHWQAPVAALLPQDKAAGAAAITPAGEAHKTLASVADLWDQALDVGLDRHSLLVALGGGVVGDRTGFAAATLLRGIRFVQLPTSLLAMVDSSVGGKTGIDRPQGKNLVGVFAQPTGVFCDLDFLRTLPDAELKSGLAEVVKAAWLAGESALARLEADADALLARDTDALRCAVRMAVQLKADIVARDEREAGLRRLLNLGHTVGHAIEAAGDYSRYRHGEAIALGLLAACRVARHLGHSETDREARMTALLQRLDLPTDLDTHLHAGVWPYLRQDKKRQGDEVHFIVPVAPGQTQVVQLPLAALPAACAPV
ncbi:MAG: 3-dehydroquinate synthase [Polyangiales bacterium]